jgi:hypothetical protein
MQRFRTHVWWIWVHVPALAVVLLLATNGDTARLCALFTGKLPPQDALCLPTLFPALSKRAPEHP